DEVERTRRHCRSDVLLYERHTAPVLLLHAEKIALRFEMIRDKHVRHFTERAFLITAHASTFQNSIIDVSSDHSQSYALFAIRRNERIPDDLQRVILFARGTAGRPARRFPLFLFGPMCDSRKNDVR